MILSQDWDKNWDSFQHNIKKQIKDVVKAEHYPILAEIIPSYEKGDKFLDAGSGLGRWVFHLEKMGFDSYGLDISDSALRMAREYAKYNNLSSKFISGDLRKIPIESGFFDLITSFGAIEHFPDSIEAVKEFYRVLKPGGCCYITTPNIYSFHGLLGGPALTLLKNRKLGYLGYENCYSPGFLADLMEKSGFVDIKYGVLQTGELFGTFYQLIPFFGVPFYRFLRKASYFLESRQSVFGFMSYSVGYRRRE